MSEGSVLFSEEWKKEWDNSVSPIEIEKAHDREALERHPQEGHIDETYGAYQSLCGQSIVVGKKTGHSVYSDNFLENEEISVANILELQKLAKRNGLEVYVARSRSDSEMVFEEIWYNFIDSAKEQERKRAEEEAEAVKAKIKRERKLRIRERKKWERENPELYHQEKIEDLARWNPSIIYAIDAITKYKESVEGLSTEESRIFAEKYALSFGRRLNRLRIGLSGPKKVCEIYSQRINQYLEDRFDLPPGSKLSLDNVFRESVADTKKALRQ